MNAMAHVHKNILKGVTKVMKYWEHLSPESLTSLCWVTGLSPVISAQDKMVPACCLCPQLLICQNHCSTTICIVLWVRWACPEARTAHCSWLASGEQLLPCSQGAVLGCCLRLPLARWFCPCLSLYWYSVVCGLCSFCQETTWSGLVLFRHRVSSSSGK